MNVALDTIELAIFSITLGQEKTAIVQRLISMHGMTNQPTLTGVHGQWHGVL